MKLKSLITMLVLGCTLCPLALPGEGEETAAPGGWIRLVKGSGFDAWRTPEKPRADDWIMVGDVRPDPENPALFTTEPGRGILVNGVKGRTRHLFSLEEFGDVEAHIEFMVPKGSNSGVYFMGRYEIQVLDSFGKEEPQHSDCGGIYQRWDPSRGQGKQGYEGRPPRVNASREPGRWQSFDVIFRAPRFDAEGNKIENARFVRVVHNGILVHREQEVTGPTRAAAFRDEKTTGPLMIQGDHGPVAYANIWMRKLNDETMKARLGGYGADSFSPRLPEMAGFLWSPNPQARMLVTQYFTLAGPEDALPYLAGALKIPDANIRYWAACSLARLDPRPFQLVEDVAPMLEDDNTSVRMAAALFLRDTKHHDAGLAVLIAVVEREEEGYADLAARFLGSIGPAAAPAVPALEKLAQSPNGKLKLAAREALKAIRK